VPALIDGPSSSLFRPLVFKGNADLSQLAGDIPLAMGLGMSAEMAASLPASTTGRCTAWGIPFEIGHVAVLFDQPVSVDVPLGKARWLVFLHTSDTRSLPPGNGSIISPMRGAGQLAEHAADYVILYEDGSEARVALRRRFELGAFRRRWGENCFAAVAHRKPCPQPAHHEQPLASATPWGERATRVVAGDDGPWVNWLWAWENPQPEQIIRGFRFEPAAGVVVVSAVSAGDTNSSPLRWCARRKARLVLPPGECLAPVPDQDGLLEQVRIDLGQVISAAPRLIYPGDAWPNGYNNQPPDCSATELLLEYAAHPEACVHLSGRLGTGVISIASVEAGAAGQISAVAPADRTVTVRVIETSSRLPVPVKLHLHGSWGEYLAPVDRHRILNPGFFQDYSVDFSHTVNWAELARTHSCTYIRGETLVKLPLGKVYIEVSKGFEVRPVRKTVEVTPETETIVVEIEKVLPWRERGWVTADTHVHFLSPTSAMLEGAAEGVNVINLLASQWGELMTNVGDFDGQHTWGSRAAGGDGEYLVRVGTENRQHVLGHISLLGYQGRIIAPMTTGGPDESALGDPVESLLTEWARQCRSQGGLVVVPHFPDPRAEHAAAIVTGDVDAVEMTSWDDHYSGIDPYSISDWYRYLNCGYSIPAVGGTDKMTAATAVGTVRTYARTAPQAEFTYEAWREAIRRGETFVTYGPLLEFSVDGHPMGSRIAMNARGGTVDVAWEVASVTVPMSRVELVVNGEICESMAVDGSAASGSWQVRIDRSVWLALLVRGHQPDKPEMIAAHSSPVTVLVENSPLLAAADAVTILEQIEGAMVFLDSVGTRAEDRAYKRMRLALESAYRTLHHRMHSQGHYHEHAQPPSHGGHEAG
jgi:hypothetical protein